MRILDKENRELLHPDLTLGYLAGDRLFLRRHEAVPAAAAVIERRVTRYPNGGVDIDPVVITPAVPGKAAWDEYEDIRRYIEYTDQELEAQASEKRRQARLEALLENGVLRKDLDTLHTRLDTLLRRLGLLDQEV